MVRQHVIQPDQISVETGLAWLAPMPADFGKGDKVGDLGSNTLLFEDDEPLGPLHANHDDIRRKGRGAYSHWSNRLYFSTSDGSDPRSNRHRYTAFEDAGAAAVAFGRDVTPAIALARKKWVAEFLLPGEVEYAISIATKYLSGFGQLGLQVSGLRILELGPGLNFGVPLILASHGARVTVADRFLAGWDAAYHPAFYAALVARWAGPSDALRQTVDTGSYPDSLTLLPEPAEALSDVEDSAFDVVVSNAVLEHVFDLDRVASELARVTVPGGVNIHQADLRDHLDFSNPLEFLLVEDSEYQEQFEISNSHNGNRLRLSEVEAAFLCAGFQVDESWANQIAEPAYLADFIPRLRASASSYRAWPEPALRPIGAQLTLRNVGGMVRERGARLHAECRALRGLNTP